MRDKPQASTAAVLITDSTAGGEPRYDTSLKKALAFNAYNNYKSTAKEYFRGANLSDIIDMIAIQQDFCCNIAANKNGYDIYLHYYR